MLLEEVLAQARRHEHPAGLRVRTEVRLAALTPRGRHIRVELHCAHTKDKNGRRGEGWYDRRNVEIVPDNAVLFIKCKTAIGRLCCT